MDVLAGNSLSNSQESVLKTTKMAVFTCFVPVIGCILTQRCPGGVSVCEVESGNLCIFVSKWKTMRMAGQTENVFLQFHAHFQRFPLT